MQATNDEFPLSAAASRATNPELQAASAQPESTAFLMWGNRKLIRQQDPQVRAAREVAGVASCQVLARGMTTLVLDADEDSVWKLSVDQSTYELMAAQLLWRERGLPTTLEARGQVGVTEDGLSIWLYRQERLRKPAAGSGCRRELLQLGKASKAAAAEQLSAVNQLKAVALRAASPAVAAALLRVSEFVASLPRPIGVDIHGANFMVRPATDTLVLADPIFDLSVMVRAQQAYRVRHELADSVQII